MVSKFFGKKSNRVTAIVLASAILLSTVALGLMNTFASSTDKHVIFKDPNESYAHVEVGQSKEVTFTNAYTWATADLNKASVTYTTADRTKAMVKGGTTAGETVISLATKTGYIYNLPYQITDSNKITEYTIKNNGEAFVKNKGESVEIPIKTIPESAVNDITWEAENKDFVDINGRTLTTKVEKGAVVIIGTVTDKWGVTQKIPFLLTIGVNINNLYPTGTGDPEQGKDGNWYSPIGTPPNVYEVVDKDGNSTSEPPTYVYNPDGDPGNGNDQDAHYNFDDERFYVEDPENFFKPVNDTDGTIDSEPVIWGGPDKTFGTGDDKEVEEFGTGYYVDLGQNIYQKANTNALDPNLIGGGPDLDPSTSPVRPIYKHDDGKYYVGPIFEGENEYYYGDSLTNGDGLVNSTATKRDGTDDKFQIDENGNMVVVETGDTGEGVVGPDADGNYYRPIGNPPNIFEVLADKDGTSKNPPEYVYDADGNPKNGVDNDAKKGTDGKWYAEVEDGLNIWQPVDDNGNLVNSGYVGGGSAGVPNTNIPAQKAGGKWYVGPFGADDHYWSVGENGKSESDASGNYGSDDVKHWKTDDGQMTTNDPANPTQPTEGGGTAVDGRVLTAEQAGDTSSWIEVAKNGGYSLIVRADILPNQITISSAYDYAKSDNGSRTILNTWFASLEATTGLRSNAVTNNAIQKLGSHGVLTSANGMSVPTTTLALEQTDNVAFLLSFNEAAQYCSPCWLKIPASELIPSSSVAKKNFNKFNNQETRTWLRSFTTAGNTYSMGTLGDEEHCEGVCGLSDSFNKTKCGLRPAMWVKSSIFDVTVSSIAVTKAPTKTTYTAGEYVNTAGMEVTVTYSDGTTKKITSGFGYTPTAALTTSDTAVTVSYEGKTATTPITVNSSSTPPTSGGTTAAIGRGVTAAVAGDSSAWIEIATNGDYSLIVRKKVLANQKSFSAPSLNAYNDVSPTATIYPRGYMNNWYANLPEDSGLRQNAVTHNALSKCGVSMSIAKSGISDPTGELAGSATQDVAFLLSFSEYANFCSVTWFYGGAGSTYSSSSPKAIYNASQITYPNNSCWTRTNHNNTGDLIATYSTNQSVTYISCSNQYGYTRPALWVRSSIVSPLD